MIQNGLQVAKFTHTALDGKKCTTQFYHLEVISAVGYRANY